MTSNRKGWITSVYDDVREITSTEFKGMEEVEELVNEEFEDVYVDLDASAPKRDYIKSIFGLSYLNGRRVLEDSYDSALSSSTESLKEEVEQVKMHPTGIDKTEMLPMIQVYSNMAQDYGVNPEDHLETNAVLANYDEVKEMFAGLLEDMAESTDSKLVADD